MPQFLVKRDTFISHLGRLVRAGETVSFDLPPALDEKGKPKKDAKGKPVLMSVGDNLEPVGEAKDTGAQG